MAKPTRRVRLIHWKREEATARSAFLRTLGYEVESETLDGPTLLRALREAPPAAIVIDLSRLPSQGRDVALAIRVQKATREVPLVLVGGDDFKVSAIRELLPDVVFASWTDIASALTGAIASPPGSPVVPASALAGYSGTPLPKKLGIAAGTDLVLINEPDDFLAALGELPAGVTVSRRYSAGATLVIWFVRNRRTLDAGVRGLARRLVTGSLWIVWPKKSSALASDLGERDVRAAGLGAGLVDYKVCAIDATWSGLLFTRRRADRT
jgi:CheY-like chemotaxis protein